MNKYVYKHKVTKRVIVSGEKLSAKHWEKVSTWKNGQIDFKKIKTK